MTDLIRSAFADQKKSIESTKVKNGKEKRVSPNQKRRKFYSVKKSTA